MEAAVAVSRDHALLDAMADVMERLAGGGHGAFLILDEGGAVQSVIAPSLPPALQAELAGMVTDDHGPGGWGRTVGAVATRHGYATCWATAINGRTPGRDTGVVAMLHHDGRVPDTESWDLLARFSRLAAVALAGSEVQEALARQALHDSLTDLPNRTLFLDRLTQAIGRLGRSRTYVAVLFLDLDRFKVVNDSLGHDAGDRLLQTVAHRLATVLRPGDTAARFGGDEFTLLCENLAGPEAAVAIAERVAATIGQPIRLDGTEVVPATSVGIALTADPAESPETLIRNADAAMYTAKERGRARFEVYDEALRARALERLNLESALRRAVERDELRLLYQPAVELRGGRVTGVEALLRWAHPDRGLLTPAQFLPAAEETGLIVAAGRWVLAEACRQAAAWWQALGYEHRTDDWTPPLTMRVNLSRRQLVHTGLVADVRRAVDDAGIPPAALCLEISEEALGGGDDAASAALRGLKELGVRLAVDDFGTGSSSLGALTRLPMDSLKVDGSFVAGLGRNIDDTTVVSAVVNLAHSLGLDAVAEGVESAGQLDALRALECDDAQGFHLAAPMAAADVEALLRAAPQF